MALDLTLAHLLSFCVPLPNHWAKHQVKASTEVYKAHTDIGDEERFWELVSVLDLKFNLASSLYTLLTFTCLIFKNIIYIYSLSCSYPSLFPSNLSTTPHILLPTPYSLLFYFLCNPMNPMTIVYMLMCLGYPYSMGNLQDATPLKKTDSPFSISLQKFFKHYLFPELVRAILLRPSEVSSIYFYLLLSKFVPLSI